MTGIVSSSWLTLETLNRVDLAHRTPLPKRAPAETEHKRRLPSHELVSLTTSARRSEGAENSPRSRHRDEHDDPRSPVRDGIGENLPATDSRTADPRAAHAIARGAGDHDVAAERPTPVARGQRAAAIGFSW